MDGDAATWWQSAGTDNEWIKVDLGKEYDIHKIRIDWGENFATLYQIEGVNESSDTAVLVSENGGDGGTDLITGLHGRARYISLLCITNNGNGVSVREFEVYYTPGQTFADRSVPGQPSDFTLLQNFPNPFNESTNLFFSIPVSGFVSLKIINPSGQEIITLVEEFKHSGTYHARWNAEEVSSGIYLVRLAAGNQRICRKMILLK